jgi:hypothetical protein
MKRARDSQRTRFWKAFQAWSKHYDSNLIGGPDGAQKLLDKIMHGRWFKAQGFKEPTIEIRTGRDYIKPNAGEWLLRVNKKTDYATVLLLFTHTIQPKDSAWHGREHCKILLELVERLMEVEASAHKLKDYFVKEKVKFKLKRQLSEATKTKARMRLAAINSPFMKELKDL